MFSLCVKARNEHKSSLVLEILKTVKRLPVTLAALQATDRAEFGSGLAHIAHLVIHIGTLCS